MIITELTIKLGILFLAASVGIGSFFLGRYKNQQDNPVEEAAEKIIELEIGKDIDLSPFTPENKEK